MDLNPTNVEFAVTTITLKKALEFCKRYFGRIEWSFLRDLGFGDIPQEQVMSVYAKVNNMGNR